MKRSRVSKVIFLVVSILAIFVGCVTAHAYEEEYIFITTWGS